MVPLAADPPSTLFTFQTAEVLGSPVTVAVYCRVNPTTTDSLFGVTTTLPAPCNSGKAARSNANVFNLNLFINMPLVSRSTTRDTSRAVNLRTPIYTDRDVGIIWILVPLVKD